MRFIVYEVTGTVQGVFFRKSSAEKAKALGVRGYIRNHNLGHVEGVAVGPEKELAAFKDYLARGPVEKGAKVEKVEIKDEGNFSENSGLDVGNVFEVR